MSSLEFKLKRTPGRDLFEVAGRLEFVKTTVDVGKFDPVVPWENIAGGVVFQMFRFDKSDVAKVNSPIAVFYGATSLVSESYL